MSINMNAMVFTVLLLLTMVLPIVYFHSGPKKKGRLKTALAVNLISFAVVMVCASVFMFSGSAEASEAGLAAGGASGATGDSGAAGMAYISAALVTGMCCIAAGLATGPAAAAALGAISENEGIMGKALIFVSLAEGISIFGIIIAFTILGRV
jgi:V/A-type H+-transporting ATPase subunit K